jgi:hypothetical protein
MPSDMVGRQSLIEPASLSIVSSQREYLPKRPETFSNFGVGCGEAAAQRLEAVREKPVFPALSVVPLEGKPNA